jgi:hypothetical protein
MEKYLRHYAEPETAALDGLFEQGQWENVLVIPACNEASDFLRPPPPCPGRSLMILVINESPSVSPEASRNNQALAAAVNSRFKSQWQSATEFGMALFQDPLAERDILLVDRFNEGRKLPPKGGVGHARKLGGDLATSLIYQKRVRSPWIHCSDADVELPDSYFTFSHEIQKQGQEYAALIYPYRHCGDENSEVNRAVSLATQLYELSLRYYVAGMKFAKSPYAFNTIGSTMVLSAAHYVKVRGFPKREAGEDFYLLNKLAKVGAMLEPAEGAACEAIRIAARCSDRVPFGTGAAVGRIIDFHDPVKEFRYYDPAVFELLRLWLQSLDSIWQSHSSQVSVNIFPYQTDDQDENKGRQILLTVLKDMKTEKALEHAFRQSKNPEQFKRQMNTWFDAFRTLKMIHALRDLHFPSISYATLVANQTFRRFLEIDPDLLTFHEGMKPVIQ